MRSNRFRAVIAACATALIASCNESTAPVIDPELDTALDELAAAEALAGPGLAMAGAMPTPASSGPVVCPYNSGNKRFECPSITIEGMTMTRYYQLLDAGGAAQPSFNANVVAIRNVMDVTGTRTLTGTTPATMQMTSHEESTLSGLKSETKTLTGNGTSTSTVTFAQGSTSSTMTRTTNLSLPKPGPDAYPTGTTVMNMTVVGSPSPALTITMTFDGTSKVKMTSTAGGNPLQTCIFDLKTPQTQPVCTSG